MRGGGHEKNHMLFGGVDFFFFLGLNLDSRKFVFNLTLGWGVLRRSSEFAIGSASFMFALESPKTKLCPLGYQGILFLDHPKDHSLFSLGLAGVSIFSNDRSYRSCHIWNHKTDTCCAPPDKNSEGIEEALF